MKKSRSKLRALICAAALLSLLGAFRIPAGADLVSSDGQLRYYDETGREASEIGMDLSFYNNQVDFEALKAQGIRFVIIRLGGRGWGTGHMYGDRQTQIFLRSARDAGLQVGAYFFSTAINVTEAVEEAEAALKTLDGYTLDLPLYIDMEWSGDYPNGRADSVSAWERAAIAAAFSDTVEAAGYRSGIYASEGYLRYETDARAIAGLPTWLANYTLENRLPEYTGDYELWQFTDSGYLGGLDGPADLNVRF